MYLCSSVRSQAQISGLCSLRLHDELDDQIQQPELLQTVTRWQFNEASAKLFNLSNRIDSFEFASTAMDVYDHKSYEVAFDPATDAFVQ